MKTYKRLTLNEVIAALRALPADAYVIGLGIDVDSYRGYYDRPAIEPDMGSRQRTHEQARILEMDLGKAVQGYKGGDYTIDGDKLLYCAHYGHTGPNIIGFEMDASSGDYHPILLAEDWHF